MDEEMKKKELKLRLDWLERAVTNARSDAFERGNEAEAYKTAYEAKCSEFSTIIHLKYLEIEKLQMQCKELRENIAKMRMAE
jgi:hypothetical protein